MSNTKQLERNTQGNSKEYKAIKHKVETTWPSWKISVYNTCVAVSAHAKKVEAK